MIRIGLMAVIAVAVIGCSDTVKIKEVELAIALCENKGGITALEADRYNGSIIAFCGDGTQVKSRNYVVYPL